MKLDDLLNHTSEWLKGTGPNSDIIISSRIRLARNLAGKPFPGWAREAQRAEVFAACQEALLATAPMKRGAHASVAELTELEKQMMVETLSPP